jgi:hypothetical protein
MPHTGGSSVFKTVPFEGCQRNIIHCFNGERRERDKGMKGIKEMRKGGDDGSFEKNGPFH